MKALLEPLQKRKPTKKKVKNIFHDAEPFHKFVEKLIIKEQEFNSPQHNRKRL